MRDFIYALFFPHPINNHRARFLHPKSILLLISFFIFCSLFFSGAYNPLSQRLKAYADISVAQLLSFTNQKRVENGFAPLVENPKLSEAASKKADDMFAKNYWAHNSPDGTTPWVFIKESGYNYVYAGENLARGFNSATDVVNAWMASPKHRANILSGSYKDVGFSVKSGRLNGEQTFLVVQEFGSSSVLPYVRREVPPKQTKPVARKVLGFEVSSLLPYKPNFSKSSEVAVFLIIGFIAILLIDLIVVERRKIVRFVGHNLDHAIYLTVIILVIYAFNIGAIL